VEETLIGFSAFPIEKPASDFIKLKNTFLLVLHKKILGLIVTRTDLVGFGSGIYFGGVDILSNSIVWIKTKYHFRSTPIGFKPQGY